MSLSGQVLTSASAIDRNKTDFYPTPPNATIALCNYLGVSEKHIWEPACGAGHMAKALERCGAKVTATELNFQGYGSGNIDFLNCDKPDGVEMIITNPPFNKSVEFIERCKMHKLPFALLLKSQYWHGAKRRSVFTSFRPSAVLPLTWRPDFHMGSKGGSPTMDVLWCVWDSNPSNVTDYYPLAKPKT